ncbi:phosphoglycerate kinase [Brevirhabdus pacifica]|uniref:Phosphoglycerate kinase n=2 Tax=Brevirhabdus pacifica TaxID=1267768 RepID=A0A1U7DM23_9RHOB|nr:phosphoglycerate kinase [Brevirhabdus pacifica]APX90965.1 phosphoglycerate kinase [Brevirhabdus pacifica]OWU76947.1 phosphoglycerate kinase [Loktanella sp. 22II-4b]PJJ86328.1 phosphoglycerate kinase [Brevirhabdus pacifica]
MDIRPVTDLDVRGLRLLVRADLNVPMQDGRVTDATRLERFAAGMRPLLAAGARLVILTHMGRPEGDMDPTYSVDKLRPLLSKAMGARVLFSDISCGQSAVTLSESLADGEALLCENVRYNPGEEANDPALAAQFALLGDVYVNDAFSCAHRAHASTEAVARMMPACAGPLLMEEIEALTTALETPTRPCVAIVGGAKVSSKIAVLRNLVQRMDTIIIGGGMANTFLFADGCNVGRSLHEADCLEVVAEIRATAKDAGCRLMLPHDVIVAREFAAGAAWEALPAHACPEDAMILDAGERSTRAFEQELSGAATILWNGPLGAFEMPPFDRATTRLAAHAGRLAARGLVTAVAGGGDTVAALNAANATQDFTYVSAAGGAFLEWLEGRTLPGIAALQRAARAA